MAPNSILFFDSGIGGLSVVKEARVILPALHYVYVADDAAFPYGDWQEAELLERLLNLFDRLIAQFRPDIIVIACNTASTLAIAALRARFPGQAFVGTVPAIKPAAERTRSGWVSVLATPGTVRRQYTQQLIDQYASQVEVNLVGSVHLAQLAEDFMRSGFVDEDRVAREIAPCFLGESGSGTDIVVLACTHFPFLTYRLRKLAPWPVDWIDSSEAIARRALSLLQASSPGTFRGGLQDFFVLTSGREDAALSRLMRGFGFVNRDVLTYRVAD